MPRVISPVMAKTTIVAPQTLLDRVSLHLLKSGKEDNQTRLITRALVNQLEREGDFEIRDILEEEENAN